MELEKFYEPNKDVYRYETAINQQAGEICVKKVRGVTRVQAF
jgi:hypothetical protein